MKLYKILETKTATVTTEYLIRASSEEDAVENYKKYGQFNGDYVSNNPEGTVVKELTEVKTDL